MNLFLINRIINLLKTVEYYIPDDKYDIISCIRNIVDELERMKNG